MLSDPYNPYQGYETILNDAFSEGQLFWIQTEQQQNAKTSSNFF